MSRPHVGRNEHLHELANELLASKAEQLFATRVGQTDDALCVDHHQPVRRELEHAAEVPLGFTQAIVGLLAARDVREADDRPEHRTILNDRRGAVLDRKALAVLAPQEFVIHPPRFTPAARDAHRTFLRRIHAPIRTMVVDQRVRLLSDHFLRRVTQHPARRGVDEGDDPVRRHPVHPLVRGIQNESRALLADVQLVGLLSELAGLLLCLTEQLLRTQTALQHFEAHRHQRHQLAEQGALARVERVERRRLDHAQQCVFREQR